MEKTSGSGSGMSLTMLFIVLKLCDVIDWSWWWVLSPTWIGMALSVFAVAVMALVAYIKTY